MPGQNRFVWGGKEACRSKNNRRMPARAAAITSSADHRVERELGRGPGKFQPALF
jgi:hypothetical protein